MEWRDRLYILSFYPLDKLRIRVYQLAIFLFFLLVTIGGFAFHSAKAQSVSDEGAISQEVATALFDHPTLRQTAARACRALFAVGQVRAEKRINFGAQIAGEREIFSNFRGQDADPNQSFRRGYDPTLDNVVDLELTARYTLYDFVAIRAI